MINEVKGLDSQEFMGGGIPLVSRVYYIEGETVVWFAETGMVITLISAHRTPSPWRFCPLEEPPCR